MCGFVMGEYCYDRDIVGQVDYQVQWFIYVVFVWQGVGGQCVEVVIGFEDYQFVGGFGVEGYEGVVVIFEFDFGIQWLVVFYCLDLVYF